MATETPPAWLQALNYGSEQTRRAVFAGFGSGGGVIGSGSLQLSVGAGVSVNVSTGPCLVAGTITNKQGLYYMLNVSTTNLPGNASDPSNPRVDRICATVDDAAYSGGSNDDKLQIVAGTATAGANLTNLTNAPALPANSCHIGYALILAGGGAYNSVQNSQTYALEGVGSPYYLAYNSVNTALSSGAYGTVTLGGTTASGYGFTKTTNTLNIPYAGLYLGIYQVNTSGSTLLGVQIQQNGANALLNVVNGGTSTIGGSGIVKCAAGDAFTMQAIATTGNPTTNTGPAQTYFHLTYFGPS